MMNDLFADMLTKFLIVFMDNMLIATKQLTDDKHTNYISRVLQRLHNNDPFLNQSKCIFFKKEIKFLGLNMLGNKIKMDEIKVKVVVD